jgi:hypothetical protein
MPDDFARSVYQLLLAVGRRDSGEAARERVRLSELRRDGESSRAVNVAPHVLAVAADDLDGRQTFGEPARFAE